eukprot:1330701-Amorphochlora_amoeboformis.AAC.1
MMRVLFQIRSPRLEISIRPIRDRLGLFQVVIAPEREKPVQRFVQSVFIWGLQAPWAPIFCDSLT